MDKPVATQHKGQSSPPSHSASKIFAPGDQRKWHDILAVDSSANDHCHTEAHSYNIMVLVEKVVGRLIAIHCCLCCVVTTNARMFGSGRIRNGWIFFKREARRKDFSICLNSDCLILYMRAKVTLGEPRLILHCWIMD